MSRGVVTDCLLQLIAKQVEDRGLVVWYDPERAYAQVAAELALPKTTIARYSDSFFRLRHEIDDLLNDSQELNNLANPLNPYYNAALVAQMQAELEAKMAQTGTNFTPSSPYCG